MPGGGAEQLTGAGRARRRRGRGRQDGAPAAVLRGARPVGADPLGRAAIRCSRRVRSGRCSTSPRAPAASSRRSSTAARMPHEVVAALARELRARAPTVFVLEDVHWADEATLDVLRLLARRVETVPALVVASYRDDELDRAPPAAARARRAGDEPRRSSGSSSRRSRRRRSRSSPSRTASTPTSSTARRPATRSSSSRRSPRGTEEIPDTVRDAVLARAARLEPAGEDAARGGRGRPAAGRALAARGARRGGRRRSRRVPDVGHAHVRAGRRRVPARARAPGDRGVGRAQPQGRRCTGRRSRRSPTHPSGAPDLARLAHHAEAARRRGRGAPLRARSGRARGVARRAPRGGRAVRARAPLRRSAVAGGAGGAARAPRPRVLPDRSVRRGDRGARGGARMPPGSWATGSKEGDALRRLSEFLWCPGRTAEAERCGSGRGGAAREPAARPRARAGRTPTSRHARARPSVRTRSDRLGQPRARARGAPRRHRDRRPRAGDDRRVRARQWRRARSSSGASSARGAAGLDEQVGRAFILLAGPAVEHRRHAVAQPVPGRGHRLLQRARSRAVPAVPARLPRPAGARPGPLGGGGRLRRARAAHPRTSTTPRIVALVVLGLVRARRGDPERVAAARRGAGRWRSRPASCRGSAPVAAARAEAAWLEGDREAVAAATEAALDARHASAGLAWLVGELAVLAPARGPRRSDCRWRWPSRTRSSSPGEWARAAELWAELGCPYEAALALATPTRRSRCAARWTSCSARRAAGGGDRGAPAARARRARRAARTAAGDAARTRPA